MKVHDSLRSNHDEVALNALDGQEVFAPNGTPRVICVAELAEELGDYQIPPAGINTVYP
ncbi:hypothetical protein [Pseudomonas oryzicola]|uniref:Uncharacterized protein n=1 Tax=Pseudomonas oryzicola TaxID=485876 RepID=A0ABS6QA62_9PSED|nr:hypothetical protein [Pseudomonas oryzicola]MBV4491083.1 hypothetical protein [Pseudomonas oryzicola]